MAIDLVTVDGLRGELGDPSAVQQNSFKILKGITALLNREEDPETVQELILLALEQRDSFQGCIPLLDSLVREVGLFPYLNRELLSTADRIAYDYHCPENMERWGVVFHRPQARVYRELMDGKNVILSAPTSFGKSLIVDAIIASQVFSDVLVIVPTIALIDETRRRLAKFRDTYKVITHITQRLEERNIFILTQERVLELGDLDRIDFLVLDEFYKLSPGRRDDDRCALLNQAFYSLAKRGKQFYMLGPSITGVVEGLHDRLEFLFIHEPYNTVISRLEHVDPGRDAFAALADLCKRLNEPTIIFCSSPNRASIIAKLLTEKNIGVRGEAVGYASDWIADHYHPEWHFVEALRNGIGVHHGRIPRALAQYVVRAFNDELLRFLICTSTLIEGVNTKAKNIVIFDDNINRAKYDMFTFNNIRGRAGRMFEHFVGHVYVFHDLPQPGLPLVDVPAFTQSMATPESLLIQLDEQDLTDNSKLRLKFFEDQEILAYEVLRANSGVDPRQQLSLAEEIRKNLRGFHPLLAWVGSPNWDQLLTVCELIWSHFGGSKLGSRSVSNSRQLATLINILRSKPRISELIQTQIAYSDGPDDSVRKTLDFLRLWANFHFPRLLKMTHRIQRHLFSQVGLPPGDYDEFALNVENYFLDPTLVALDEYGVPLELARKLEGYLQPDGDLDEVLARLKALPLETMKLTPFEREILLDAQQYL